MIIIFHRYRIYDVNEFASLEEAEAFAKFWGVEVTEEA